MTAERIYRNSEEHSSLQDSNLRAAQLYARLQTHDLLSRLANDYMIHRINAQGHGDSVDWKTPLKQATVAFRELSEISENENERIEFRNRWGEEALDFEARFSQIQPEIEAINLHIPQHASTMKEPERLSIALRAILHVYRSRTESPEETADIYKILGTSAPGKILLSGGLTFASGVPTNMLMALAGAAAHLPSVPDLQGHGEAVLASYLLKYGATVVNAVENLKALRDPNIRNSLNVLSTISSLVLKKLAPEKATLHDIAVISSFLFFVLLGEPVVSGQFALPKGETAVVLVNLANTIGALAAAGGLRYYRTHREKPVAPQTHTSVIMRAKDFGLETDIPVTEHWLPVHVTAQADRHVTLHAYTWQERAENDTGQSGSDAVFLSGLNTGAHDFIHAIPHLNPAHSTMAFISHPDGPDAKMDDPSAPFNTDSFAPSGEALLLGIEQLIQNGAMNPGVTIYSHSTGAAVCLEAIALDEKRSAQDHRSRRIKQAVLIAPAGILNIENPHEINTAMKRTMLQVLDDELHRTKTERGAKRNVIKAFTAALKKQYSTQYKEARDYPELLFDIMKSALHKGWSSVILENVMIELLEFYFENFALLENTANRFHLYWPNMLPHAWPKTPSALHNMDLILTDCTEHARIAIQSTPILLVFFGNDALVPPNKLLTPEDRRTVQEVSLSEEEKETLSEWENHPQLSRIYNRRSKARDAQNLPLQSRKNFMHGVQRRLISVRRGEQERQRIVARVLDKFPNNRTNIAVVPIAFTHHMSQRTDMDTIGLFTEKLLARQKR